MTRSGGYTHQAREEQLQRDKQQREVEAASRRLRKLYALADQTPPGPAGQQVPPQPSPDHEPPPLEHSDSDNEDFQDADHGGGDGGNGGENAEVLKLSGVGIAAC